MEFVIFVSMDQFQYLHF